MATASGTVGTELLQQGHERCLPPCSLTEKDLTDYPGLANLLMDLPKYMDSSGLSVNLAQQMEEARKTLQLRRTNWLKWEALYRLLQEALRELAADLSPQDKKFLEVLEQQLLVTELKRTLDLDRSLQGAQSSLLGLESSHIMELLPSNQELEEMRKRLPVELEKYLKSKCLAVLSYYRPESDGAGETARAAMFVALPEKLVVEKQRLKEAQTRHEELVGLLEQQKAAYPQVLLRCLAILKHLARESRLGTQSQLDSINAQYLEMKCSAMFLKIWLEQLSILVETYAPEKVAVHRMMRDSLQTTLTQEEQELATSKKILSNYEVLGPEFEELVKDYAQLQSAIENRRWVLAEFHKDR